MKGGGCDRKKARGIGFKMADRRFEEVTILGALFPRGGPIQDLVLTVRASSCYQQR